MLSTVQLVVVQGGIACLAEIRVTAALVPANWPGSCIHLYLWTASSDQLSITLLH